MKDYTISETFVLPSKGKIYNSVVPEVRLRSMSTMEEMKRLSPTDTPYKTMSEIIDDCLIDDIGISSYDLCIGDYLFLLHRLRVVTYGSKYTLTSICPFCGCENTDTIDLLDIPIKEYDEENEKYRSFILPTSGKEILLKYQTPRMVDTVELKVKELKKEIADLKAAEMSKDADAFLDDAKEINGVRLVTKKFDDYDIGDLRNLSDNVKAANKNVAMVFASVSGGKVTFLVSLTDDLVEKGMHAGKMIKEIAKAAGGGGGGKADMAQAGAKDPSKVEDAFAKAAELL